MKTERAIFGMAAEFDSHVQLLKAARSARAQGYKRMDAYAPFPVEGLPSALGRKRSVVPLVVLIGGILGGSGGYFMQWYANVVSYPINIAGRPLHSWPMFIPITFELTVLGAALFAFFGTLVMNKLPQPYHPIFHTPNFERASIDRFFLCIEADDEKFDALGTRQFLESLKPLAISEVPM
jgi:Protein of unknown function (DUF3341)